MGFLNLENIQEREIVPGYRARFLHSDHMTVAYGMSIPGCPPGAQPSPRADRQCAGRPI